MSQVNLFKSIAIFLCVAILPAAIVPAQEIDQELTKLGQELARQVKEQGKKKVAVVDFADLQGSSQGELGKYIAEQLTVDLVMGKRDFAVLDRANLSRILAEHKLTAKGLIDPENAKKLGMFAGVDALILGTIIPRSQSIALNAKIITTDTAEIVGAARAEFKADSAVQQLTNQPATEVKAAFGSGDLSEDKPSVVKSFGDLRIAIQPLRISEGAIYELTMVLTNQNASKSLWVAVSGEMFHINGQITDAHGAQFLPDLTRVSGISVGTFARYGYTPNTFSPATEIPPHNAITATMAFRPREQKPAEAGACRLQLELLLGRNYMNNVAANVSFPNLTATVEAK